MLNSALHQIQLYESTKIPTFEVAQAYYNVGKIDESELIIAELQNNNVTGKALKKLNDKIKIQQLQISEGVYDYKSMYEEAQSSFFVKCSNYINPNIEVRQIDQSRCGYFAKQKIEIGTILIAEKSFLFGDYDAQEYQLQIKKKLKDKQVEQYLLSQKYAELNEEILIQSSDKEFTFDELTAKCGINTFTALPRLELEFQADSPYYKYPTRLFSGSLINHSCIPNAFWYFIGDIQFIISQKEIQKDEQVLITLLSIDHQQQKCSYDQHPKQLLELFDYQCQCEMCLTITDKQRQDLSKLANVLDQKMSAITTKNKATQNEIESINDISTRAKIIIEDCKGNKTGICYFTCSLIFALQQNPNIQNLKKALQIEINNLQYYGINCEQAQRGRLVMLDNVPHQLNQSVIDRIFSILTLVKVVNNASKDLWLKFLGQVFNTITGGCENYKFYLKKRLAQVGVNQ
ncbi:SET_domain-containing protein [Hexamita inflata]|uniref:SET domain-containing protein n=1 Tax=Hexamita inflata TaxID=28002 RepID=A0AA86NNQ9_9EUKA|nr:SET domain-containing protein [Hexamita inflata]